MREGSRNIDVIFRKKPYMEITMTAWKIDPKYRNEIDVFISSRCKSGDIPPEFGDLIEKRSIGRFIIFKNFDGFSRGMLDYGTWAMVMMSDTRGTSRVELITINPSTPERVTLDYTRRQ